MAFQSTLSSRRATSFRFAPSLFICYFNPRSPHGERRTANQSYVVTVTFQSTLSSRRATSSHCTVLCKHRISIHALLTESDFDYVICVLT